MWGWFHRNIISRFAVEPIIKPSIMLTEERFLKITSDIVIPNFESGYYHPDMLLKMNAHDRALLAASGETIYGEDRMAGSALSVYPQWGQLWAIIDQADARHKWPHYYMGGELAPQLKQLVSKIMCQWFNHLAAKYLKGDAIDKIAADDRLVIHFAYSCWNGEGWFKKFAAALNAAKGTKEEIFNAAISARLKASNEAIRNAGAKMIKMFHDMKL